MSGPPKRDSEGLGRQPKRLSLPSQTSNTLSWRSSIEAASNCDNAEFNIGIEPVFHTRSWELMTRGSARTRWARRAKFFDIPGTSYVANDLKEMTPKSVARFDAQGIGRGDLVVELCSGFGCNTKQMSERCGYLVAVDTDASRIAAQRDIPNVCLVVADAVEFLNCFRFDVPPDVVFTSPPWGEGHKHTPTPSTIGIELEFIPGLIELLAQRKWTSLLQMYLPPAIKLGSIWECIAQHDASGVHVKAVVHLIKDSKGEKPDDGIHEPLGDVIEAAIGVTVNFRFTFNSGTARRWRLLAPDLIAKGHQVFTRGLPIEADGTTAKGWDVSVCREWSCHPACGCLHRKS